MSTILGAPFCSHCSSAELLSNVSPAINQQPINQSAKHRAVTFLWRLLPNWPLLTQSLYVWHPLSLPPWLFLHVRHQLAGFTFRGSRFPLPHVSSPRRAHVGARASSGVPCWVLDTRSSSSILQPINFDTYDIYYSRRSCICATSPTPPPPLTQSNMPVHARALYILRVSTGLLV